MSGWYVAGSWTHRGPRSPLDHGGAMRGPALTLIRAGLTLQDVARELGCSTRTLHRWQRRDEEARNAYETATVLRSERYAPWRHGTVRGYNRHLDEASEPCADCRKANTLRHRDWAASHGLLVIDPDSPVLPAGKYRRGELTRHRMSIAKRGENSPRAKLTENDVRDIRALSAEGYTNVELAERYGIAVGTLGNVVQRRTWRHVE